MLILQHFNKMCAHWKVVHAEKQHKVKFSRPLWILLNKHQLNHSQCHRMTSLWMMTIRSWKRIQTLVHGTLVHGYWGKHWFWGKEVVYKLACWIHFKASDRVLEKYPNSIGIWRAKWRDCTKLCDLVVATNSTNTRKLNWQPAVTVTSCLFWAFFQAK